MELVCAIQNYDWGRKGMNSLAARIAQTNMSISILESKPYAEFWMGTHPNGPSTLKEKKVPLSQHLLENPSELGSEVIRYFNNLPFLFKVLSVKKSLSLQVHPSKSEAEILNKTMPDIYKDPNHKPELAIALTEFKALCSFRPWEEIKYFLQNVPEFGYVIQKEKIEGFVNCNENNFDKSNDLMKDCFKSLMLCPTEVVASAVDNLVERLNKSSDELKEKCLYDLVVKLNSEFPGDVGIFCIYWLNYIVLKPGEAIYLAPNEPHAYLSGECMECMANSDNVVRAGLTPKLKDVTTLCQMLSYTTYSSSDVIFKPIRENEFSLLFSPPVKDFAVAKIVIPAEKEYLLLKRQSASILIVIDGHGVTRTGSSIKSGCVYYLPSEEEFYIKSKQDVMIFQAFCNVHIDM
ncbi:UNVERIFIED_CONTAM: hypothetical protein PYX00_007943 [Menopon gallinae]|uniref:Mannose-6-phosphate isomerase n=1 Tax=Menopon gallinae TaxID=328185 RepID=A0AAW2HL88_9NEOP